MMRIELKQELESIIKNNMQQAGFTCCLQEFEHGLCISWKRLNKNGSLTFFNNGRAGTTFQTAYYSHLQGLKALRNMAAYSTPI